MSQILNFTDKMLKDLLLVMTDDCLGVVHSKKYCWKHVNKDDGDNDAVDCHIVCMKKILKKAGAIFEDEE